MENNLALQIVDEEVQEGFVVDSDDKAEWCLRKISEEKALTQRYLNTCQTMINEYKFKMEKEEEKLRNKLAYFEGQLRGYFETVDKKKTKTQESYKLPGGTLKLKYKEPEIKKDDTKLVEWLKASGKNEFVKVKESADWAGLKKTVTITGDKAVTEDGEVVEGIELVERQPEFVIET